MVTGKACSDKASIRRRVFALRDAISPGHRKAKEEKIQQRFVGLDEFGRARIILFYASFRSEVDTFRLMEFSKSQGKRIVLPKVESAEDMLVLFEVNNLEELRPGHWGIPEPVAATERKRDVQAVDLIVVPGAAFDEQCNRLGYGKGFYDKLLDHRRAPAIALSFEEQVVPCLPAEPHDIRMDRIVTDQRLIGCHGP